MTSTTMKIAIGTDAPYKIHAIKKALYELDFDFIATNIAVESGISEQPHEKDETKKGSVNRAKNALSQLPESDIGLGVEFGYEPVDDTYHMVCWASIATKDGTIYSEHSSSLELPRVLKQVLLEGNDVSDSIDSVFTVLEDSERNRIFKQFLKKRQAIYESVTNVVLRFLLDSESY